MEMVRDFLDVWGREGHGYWTVELEGVLIGVAGVKPLDFHGRRCWNLYYRFSPSAWGKGLATEAVRGVLGFAQANEPSRPVVARTRPTNDAAKRLAERVGLHRRADLDQDGFAVFAIGW